MKTHKTQYLELYSKYWRNIWSYIPLFDVIFGIVKINIYICTKLRQDEKQAIC